MLVCWTGCIEISVYRTFDLQVYTFDKLGVSLLDLHSFEGVTV